MARLSGRLTPPPDPIQPGIWGAQLRVGVPAAGAPPWALCHRPASLWGCFFLNRPHNTPLPEREPWAHLGLPQRVLESPESSHTLKKRAPRQPQ